MVVFKHVEHESEVKFWIVSPLSALWTQSKGFSITTVMPCSTFLYEGSQMYRTLLCVGVLKTVMPCSTFLYEGSQMYRTQIRSQILDWEPFPFIVDTEERFQHYKHYSSFYFSVWGSQIDGKRILCQILDLESR